MSDIANGTSHTAISRAADVVLKEQRRLVLMLRETHLQSGHLESLLMLARMGAVIAPPVPAFYLLHPPAVGRGAGRPRDPPGARPVDIDNDLP